MSSRKKIKLPDLIVKKSMFAIDYKAKIKYFDLLKSAAETISGDDDWKSDGTSFIIFNSDKRYSITVSLTKIGYDQDESNISLEQENIKKILETIPDSLKVEECFRVGLRRRFLIPVEMRFDELVTLLDLKLFSQDGEFKKLMPKNINDLMYRIDASEGELKYHFTVGPLQKKEIDRYIGFNKEDHLSKENSIDDYYTIAKSYPDTCIFLDVDVYKEKDVLYLSDAYSFYQEFDKVIEKYSVNMRDYLFSITKPIEV